MKKPVLTFLSLLLLFSTTQAFAEDFSYGFVEAKCNCFRGKPLGECKSFYLIETGFMSRASGEDTDNDYYNDYESLLQVNLGKMYNYNSKSAIGGVFNLGPGNDGMDIGIGPRYRYWLSKRMAFDLTPMWIFARTGNDDLDGTGYQIDASIAIVELFSINAHYRNVKYKLDGISFLNDGYFGYPEFHVESHGFYFGISGRSYAAPVAPAVVLLIHWLMREAGDSDYLVIRF